MILALYILISIIFVGVVLKLTDRKPTPADNESADESDPTVDQVCCGLHLTCERDSLFASVSTEIEYFEDEELDVYAGRKSTDYDEDETEQFREVLITLRPEEIAAWSRSIQLRGIELPEEVRDELIMIVSEARMNRVQQ